MTLSLEHIIQKPTITSSDKAPLLLLLHGYGSNEEDLFSFAEELPKIILSYLPEHLLQCSHMVMRGII